MSSTFFHVGNIFGKIFKFSIARSKDHNPWNIHNYILLENNHMNRLKNLFFSSLISEILFSYTIAEENHVNISTGPDLGLINFD